MSSTKRLQTFWHAALLTPFAVVLVALHALALRAPHRYSMLMQEDGWAEWATFLVFLGAGVVAAVGAVGRVRSRLERFAFVCLALFCLFVAGEEISWGQRLFAFQPPELFLEHNYQQEMNLHNLLKDIFDTRWQVFIVATAYGVLAPILAWWRWLPGALAPAAIVAPMFAAAAFLEFAYPFKLAGELAELLLGLGLAADVALRLSPGDLSSGTRRTLAMQGGALAAAVVIGPVVDFVVYGSSTVRVTQAKTEVSQLESDLKRDGALPKKLLERARVHKRVYTAAVQRYIRPGKGAFTDGQLSVAEEDGTRRDRRGYFLDPWNQPYWLAYERSAAKSRLLVYSFGPNRRRDTQLARGSLLRGAASEILRGDDVGRVIEMDGAEW